MSDEIANFELEFKLRNNSIKERRERLGLKQTELADILGISHSTISHLETFRMDPWSRKRNKWKDVALKLAKFFDVEPGELWPELTRYLTGKPIQRKLTEFQLYKLYSFQDQMMSNLIPELPDEVLDKKLMVGKISKALTKVSKRKRKAVIMRYGLDGNGEHCLEDIGRELDCTRESVRQIISAGLVKLVREINKMGID